MEDGTKAFFKQLRAQDKVAKITNAYTTIEGKVKGFLTALPLVSDLRHPSMRPRHWNMLRQLTGKQFDETSPEFDLRTLNDLHLDEFEDDVGEVSQGSACLSVRFLLIVRRFPCLLSRPPLPYDFLGFLLFPPLPFSLPALLLAMLLLGLPRSLMLNCLFRSSTAHKRRRRWSKR